MREGSQARGRRSPCRRRCGGLRLRCWRGHAAPSCPVSTSRLGLHSVRSSTGHGGGTRASARDGGRGGVRGRLLTAAGAAARRTSCRGREHRTRRRCRAKHHERRGNQRAHPDGLAAGACWLLMLAALACGAAPGLAQRRFCCGDRTLGMTRVSRWRRRAQGALGAAASEAAKALSHSLSFALNLAVLSNLVQHTYHRTGGRTGPALLVALSVPLVCADPLRHVLQDAGVWSGERSHMYLPADASSVCVPGGKGDALCRAPRAAGGYAHPRPWICDAERSQCVCPEASIRCLSPVGWLFTITFTYAGFACLFAGARLHACRISRFARALVKPILTCCRAAQACCGALTCRASCARHCRRTARHASRKTRARAPPALPTRARSWRCRFPHARATPSYMTPRRETLAQRAAAGTSSDDDGARVWVWFPSRAVVHAVSNRFFAARRRAARNSRGDAHARRHNPIVCTDGPTTTQRRSC